MKILTTSFKSKHPKTVFYGGAGSTPFRVAAAVSQQWKKHWLWCSLWDLLFFLFAVKFVCIAVKFVCIYFALHVTFFVSILQEINLIKILSWKFSILIVFFNIIRCFMLFDCFCSFTKTCLRVKKNTFFSGRNKQKRKYNQKLKYSIASLKVYGEISRVAKTVSETVTGFS